MERIDGEKIWNWFGGKSFAYFFCILFCKFFWRVLAILE
jgi:hypothetical protein